MAREEYDPDELYEETSVEEIEKWLGECEDAARVEPRNGGTEFSAWERDFLESIRGQFEERRTAGRRKPLSGRQLVSLRKCWDKV